MNELNPGNTDYLRYALGYFPARLRNALFTASSKTTEIEEIRAVAGANLCVVTSGRLVSCGTVCRADEMRMLVMTLCGNSVYSHSETIKEGYIITADGIRAGVCGKAVTESGRIVAVTDISGVTVRIPSRRYGFADELFAIMKNKAFTENVLIYSPPGGGKTTLLRELASKLVCGDDPLRVAVVDTRYEIAEGLRSEPLFVLSGYPRAKGIEIALRTLSPRIIICDEISAPQDAEAVSFAIGAGATVVASCHSDGRDIKRRASSDLFEVFYGVNKTGAGSVTRKKAA